MSGYFSCLVCHASRTAEGQGTVMTVEKAVRLLTQNDVDLQVSAASFLQHQCFNSADAKRMVNQQNSPSGVEACWQSMRYTPITT